MSDPHQAMAGDAEVRHMPVWAAQPQPAPFRPSTLLGAMAGAEAFDTFADGDEDGESIPGADPVFDIDDFEAIAEQRIAEAYRQGVIDGQNAATETQLRDERAAVAVADAIANLRPQMSDAICALLLGTIRDLLVRTMGAGAPDETLLAAHCDALARLVTRDMDAAMLFLHPSDLTLLGDHEFGLTLAADDQLARGTVRLAHGDGWIEQGTQPLLDELQSLIDGLETGQ